MNKLGPSTKLHQNQTIFVDWQNSKHHAQKINETAATKKAKRDASFGKINGNKFSVIVRHSLKPPSFGQYFVVLGKSIFLHFRSISNKL
ncbi:hypothetical protein T12_3759 [Trichinella patagoniensis]|uniref:Uncharacterized protein n=1 Tax=Trichinella patagoniensis TaxID=990121 RepID=A0A0V1AFF2_9BILA|nr:hypothetical protein T12_3759 [Trichinella patagoniensis]